MLPARMMKTELDESRILQQMISLDSFMPFFSAGGSNIVLAYIFLGIILSIYKYKDAYPQHMDIGIRGRLKLGSIEIMKN